MTSDKLKDGGLPRFALYGCFLVGLLIVKRAYNNRLTTSTHTNGASTNRNL